MSGQWNEKHRARAAARLRQLIRDRRGSAASDSGTAERVIMLASANAPLPATYGKPGDVDFLLDLADVAAGSAMRSAAAIGRLSRMAAEETLAKFGEGDDEA